MRMRSVLRSALLPLTVIMILATLGAAVYSGFRYFQLRHETEILRLLPKDDASWGMFQLVTEEHKLINAINLAAGKNSSENLKNLSLRLDILYSRFGVTTEVFDRQVKWVAQNHSAEIYPVQAVFMRHINDDLLEIRRLFNNVDREVQDYLKTDNSTRLPEIRGWLGHMIKLSSELASQVNQASNQSEFNIRENIITLAHQFQMALLTIIFTIMMFSVVSLTLYLNARRAERRQSLLVEDLQVANRAKTEFLSSMSHELRTPLNAVLGFGQILESNPGEPLTTRQQKCVDNILSSGSHLLDLINEVLDLSRIESGKLEISLAEISVIEVIEDCLLLVNSQAKERRVSIKNIYTENISITADYTRLKQVLLNLLSNAIKYNIEGGSISLATQLISDNRVRISVTDTGIGIPEDLSERLFEPFDRLGKESSGIQGTGVGLTISTQLVEAMGGQIGYQSEFGKGSTFWVEFPSTGNQSRNRGQV